MNPSMIEIRRADDGTILARRIDGEPLTDADREEAKRMASCVTEPPAIDAIVDDRTIAVLIDSTVLGAAIWFALRNGWTPNQDDKAVVFYASELPALREKSAEQLRSIFKVKTAFGAGMVRQ